MTRKDIIEIARQLGIELPEDTTVKNGVVTVVKKKLSGTSIPVYERIAHKIYSPMLCSSYYKLTEGQKNELLNSQDWSYEKNVDGLRGFLCFSRRNGSWSFLTRERKDNLFREYFKVKSNGNPDRYLGLLFDVMAFVQDDVPQKILNHFNKYSDFVLYCLRTRKYRVKFCLIDVLTVDTENIAKNMYRDRCVTLKQAYDSIKSVVNVCILEHAITKEDKEKMLLDTFVNGDGVIIKNLDSFYDYSGNRSKLWYKQNKPLSSILNKNIFCKVSSHQHSKRHRINKLGLSTFVDGVFKRICDIDINKEDRAKYEYNDDGWHEISGDVIRGVIEVDGTHFDLRGHLKNAYIVGISKTGVTADCRLDSTTIKVFTKEKRGR